MEVPAYLFLALFFAAFSTSSSRRIKTTKLREINIAQSAATAEVAETTEVVCIVIISRFILLILIDPLSPVSHVRPIHTPISHAYLVEVGLQEMSLLVRSQKTRPVLLLKLLLPQDKLNLAVIVVHFSVVGVNLAI